MIRRWGHRAIRVCGACIAITAGCTGQIVEPSANSPGKSDESSKLNSAGLAQLKCEPQAQLDSGPTPLRRLSRAEYLATLESLFEPYGGKAEKEIRKLNVASDEALHGFENTARKLAPSALLIEQRFSAARKLAEIVADAPQKLIPCSIDETGCARTFVEDFGRRAFRRPLTKEQTDAYAQLFSEFATAIDAQAAIQLTVEAFLQAPEFLYRIEHPSAEDPARIDEFSLATRLSYFLWGSMPDDELLEAATSKTLRQDFDHHVERMLSDERTASQFVEFHRQWLDFDGINDEEKQREQFPLWKGALRNSIREESDRFVREVVFNGTPSLSALFTSRETITDSLLAELYGIDVPMSDDWQRATLPHDERAGVLTRANFLASHAHPTNGSPPLRGVAFMERIFCQELPPPPPDADTSVPEANEDQVQTNRELFEERTSPAACQGCHQRIDNFGFAFEHYDSIGAFRSVDNTKPVDARVQVQGTDIDGEYANAVFLSEAIPSSQQVAYCTTINWFRFATGRLESESDGCRVKDLGDQFIESDGDFKALLRAIVTQPAFQSVGGPE